MHGDGSRLGPELQPVAQEGPDKLRRFVQFHAADLFAHAVQARALVAQHRPATLPAGAPQRLFQLGGLAVGNVGHAFALPDRAAAETFHILGKNDLVTCLAEQRDHLAGQRFRDRRFAGGAHRPVDAAREIDHLVRFRHGCLALRFGHPVGPRHRGQPLGKPQRMQALRHGCHRPRSEHPVRRIGHRQHGTQGAFQSGEMTGSEFPGGMPRTPGRHPQRTQGVGQLSRIDSHGTARRAEPVPGAGPLPGITVAAFELPHEARIPTGGFQPGDLAAHDDALARRKGQPARQAVHLTEPAFDAAVDQRIGQRQRFEMGEMAAGIVVEDHPGVQQPRGVEQLFDSPHHGTGGVAPLAAEEGRHVAPRAVLGFERAVVPADDEFRNVVHQRLVAGRFDRGRERLVDDEMVVALERMPVDTGIVIAVAGNQRLQFGGRTGQVPDMKGDIFDQAGGPGGTAAAHRRKDARTEGPKLRLFGRIVGEPRGNIERKAPQQLPDAGDVGGQLLGCVSLGLGQQGRQPLARGVADRCQRLAVEHLGAVHDALPGGVLQFAHLHDGPARLADVAEIDHRAGLVFVFALGAHRNPGQERQRPLGTDHKVGDDLERIVEAHQRQQVQPHDIFDRIFVQDTLRQGLVAANPVAQRFNGSQELRMALRKGPAARLVTRIEQRAVGQHQPRREQHPVAVGVGAAIHARGVVHHDTAHHRASDRSRVGREAVSIRFQHLVDPGPHDAGLKPHGAASVEHLAALPMFARHHEHRVADGLPREARARGPEGAHPAGRPPA